MKNKIEFPENDATHKQFINQTSAGSSFDLNHFFKTDKKESSISSKLIKGKVKVYNSNAESKLINNDWYDDQEELEIVWKRMLAFLKFIFVFLLVTSIFILIKKNAH